MQNLELWVQEKIEVCVTEHIYTEYLRVLQHIGDQKNTLSLEWISFLAHHATIYRDHHSTHVVCRDPDDQKFLNCAVTAKVDFLISGDNDLLVLQHVDRIPIISPGEFIAHFHRLS